MKPLNNDISMDWAPLPFGTGQPVQSSLSELSKKLQLLISKL